MKGGHKPLADLEFLTFWFGGASASEMARALNVTREHFQSNVVSPYKRAHPETLGYDKDTKRTRFLGDAWSLKWSPSGSIEAFSQFYARQAEAEAMGAELQFHIPVVDALDIIQQNSDFSDLLRVTTEAIYRKQVLRIDYLTKKGLIERFFSPHTLVRTAFRIHARGAIADDGGSRFKFVDLLPARIERAEIALEQPYLGRENDLIWNEQATVVLKLNPDLPRPMYVSIAKEAMISDDGLVNVRTNRALAGYVRSDMLARRVHSFDGPVWLDIDAAPV